MSKATREGEEESEWIEEEPWGIREIEEEPKTLAERLSKKDREDAAYRGYCRGMGKKNSIDQENDARTIGVIVRYLPEEANERDRQILIDRVFWGPTIVAERNGVSKGTVRNVEEKYRESLNQLGKIRTEILHAMGESTVYSSLRALANRLSRLSDDEIDRLTMRDMSQISKTLDGVYKTIIDIEDRNEIREDKERRKSEESRNLENWGGGGLKAIEAKAEEHLRRLKR